LYRVRKKKKLSRKTGEEYVSRVKVKVSPINKLQIVRRDPALA
jgi:hypothetical protein